MQRGLYMNCATADSYVVSISVAVSGVADSWQLSIPATSVEAERAFAAGVLCTKLWSQLADNSIDTMCFLHSYYMKRRTCN